MKTEKYYLVLFVFGILCVPALGAIESLSSDYTPALPDLSASAGVVVMISPAASNIEGLPWGELVDKVNQKITEAAIKKYSGPIRGNLMSSNLPISILRVDIDMLTLDNLQQYVLRIQTSLAADVSLANEPERRMKADVWWTEPAMQVVSIKDMPAKVTEVVLRQVDRFIESYLAANPPGTRVSNVSDANVVPETGAAKRPAKTAEQPSVEYQFVASKISDVFHRPDCSLARKIKPANLVSYTSRQAAMEAGKRPCKICKP
jgi:hypothetical protein